MAGKKSKRKGYKSAGVHGTTGLRLTASQKAHNKHLAWAAGKNPWITVANATTGERTNKPFKRVRANDYWGRPPFPGMQV